MGAIRHHVEDVHKTVRFQSVVRAAGDRELSPPLPGAARQKSSQRPHLLEIRSSDSQSASVPTRSDMPCSAINSPAIFTMGGRSGTVQEICGYRCAISTE